MGRKGQVVDVAGKLTESNGASHEVFRTDVHKLGKKWDSALMNKYVTTGSDTGLDANQSRSVKMQRNKNAAKHRHYLIKAALKDVDLRRIDRRTALGAEMARRREQIIADAGGQENLTELKADLIEKYLRTVILIENVDSYLFQQRSLVRKRTRSLLPVVQQRTQLVESALRLAQAIGLGRIKRPASDLKSYIAQKNEKKGTESSSEARKSPPAESDEGACGTVVSQAKNGGNVVMASQPVARKPRLPCMRQACNDPFCDRWHEGDDDNKSV